MIELSGQDEISARTVIPGSLLSYLGLSCVDWREDDSQSACQSCKEYIFLIPYSVEKTTRHVYVMFCHTCIYKLEPIEYFTEGVFQLETCKEF